MDILKKFRFVYCVLFVLIVVPIFSQTAPKPTLTSSQGSVIGGEKKYTCSYLYKHFLVNKRIGFRNLFWFYNGMMVGNVYSLNGILLYKAYPPVTRDQISEAEDNLHVESVLTIPNLGCNDEGVYMCRIFGHSANVVLVTINTTREETLAVTKQPGNPTLVYSPKTVVENETVTFTCSGNVGRPAENLGLYLLKNQNDPSPVVMPSVDGQPVLDVDGCSYKQTISSTVTLTRANKGAYVSCRVKGNPVYMQTVSVRIQYLVRAAGISFDNSLQTTNNTLHTVGEGSQYRLSCEADADPPATLRLWHVKSDQSTELVTERLPLVRWATKGHAGGYYCSATNVLTNQRNNTVESYLLTLIVSDKVTTVSTSTVSTTKQPGGTTAKTTGNPSSGNTGAIAGGVVAGIVVVVVIVVVLIVVCRKKGPKKFPNSQNSNVKPTNNLGSGTLYKESEPDLYKSHKQPSTPGNHNPGYNRQDDYLNHIPMSSEGRSRNPVVLNENPYAYTSSYPDSLASQYSHSRPV